MDLIILHLCQIQARLFELSVVKGYDSKNFITKYMNSDIASHFNSNYDALQWMGEEYILDYLNEECILTKGPTYSKDEMFWIGYIYCYWHFRTNETCKTIYNTAKPDVIRSAYLGFHTISYELAIENLMEIDIKSKIKRLNKNTFQYIMMNEVEMLIDKKSNKNSNIFEQENIKNTDDFQNAQNKNFINEIISLIDDSNWTLRKKAEYRVIINLLCEDIINEGFTNYNYKFMNDIFNNLSLQK